MLSFNQKKKEKNRRFNIDIINKMLLNKIKKNEHGFVAEFFETWMNEMSSR